MIIRIIISCTVLVATISCSPQADDYIPMEEESWRLGWRMVENYWEEDYKQAELQFDSLLAITNSIDERVLTWGLMTKQELSKEEEVAAILAGQPQAVQREICLLRFAKDVSTCDRYPKEKVENEELQLEIIKLFVADQAIRGHLMKYNIEKYGLDSTSFKREYTRELDEPNIDEVNRTRLKALIEEFGFPTRKMVGQEAMQGVFFMVQHADGDTAWQKSQLPNLKRAAEMGDIEKRNYAYLVDRIRVNSGEPQLYGSQFAKVDPKNGIAELRETEDVANLDERRRRMGMMPIDFYKRLILRP